MKNNSKLNYERIFFLFLFFIVCVLTNNVIINLIRTNVGISFQWLQEPSGFAIGEKSLPYTPSDTYARAIFVGWINSLKVIFFGLIISTVLGFITGFARINKNILIRSVSGIYVSLARQTPLLLQLLFWYFVGFLSLSSSTLNILGILVTISNQGINFLGVNLSVEFSALLLGLSIFTGASISEIVRGGINSVPIGQWEAFRSLGVKDTRGMMKIIVPQALPAIIPGLTSQYLNLAKNSTLAIAIGYSDIYAISDTSITQTGRAIEGFIILLISFLSLNLMISSIMNIVNKSVIKYKGLGKNT